MCNLSYSVSIRSYSRRSFLGGFAGEESNKGRCYDLSRSHAELVAVVRPPSVAALRANKNEE